MSTPTEANRKTAEKLVWQLCNLHFETVGEANEHTAKFLCGSEARDGLAASLTAARERVRVLEEALAFITKHGGMTFETECGEVQCSGFWCAEQARAALAKTAEPVATPRKEGSG